MEAVVIAVFMAIYFLSGFSALLYQVVWQRMLAIFSGSDLYATTTIVASFMAGLGAGSLLGGPLADKLSPRWQIGMFALAEFLIGAFALVSKWWYYDVLYIRHAELANSPLVLAAVLFGSLLIPTFCMGMSFPLLSKALTPAIELAGRRIGSLYALNTLGAALGAFATAWFLMGDLDFPKILRLGARINIAVAILAPIVGSVLWRRLSAGALPRETAGEGSSGANAHIFSFSTWMLIYALAGFLALSLEIVWFRLLGVILKSNSFTFPHLLAIYLASLAVGIMAGARLVQFGKQPARVYLGLQSGITLYAGLSVVFLLWALDHWPAAEWLRTYLAGYEPFDVTRAQRAFNNWSSAPAELLQAITGSQPNFVALYVLVPILMIAPPTFMMGASFAFLQRAVQDNRAQLGRRVGWLQAANIFGATFGAILVGTVFLHFLGVSWTLRLLIVLGGTFFILWAAFSNRPHFRRLGYVAALTVPLVLMWAIPTGPELWAKLHGAPVENTISAEDGSGVSLLKNEKVDFSSTTVVHLNGLGQSWVPYFHVSGIHSQLGILPIMLHPAPKEVAVIGLGSGDTPYSLGGRSETTTITCIEIVKPQAETLRLLHEKAPYAGLEGLLNDNRYQFVFTDGRSYIAGNTKKYDVIEADALRPNSAFAGNLYSYEYFLLLKSRLNPGGLAVTWAPTGRVFETFLKVFPYAVRFDSVLIGSADPINYDPDAIRARLQSSFSEAYYAKAGIDAKALVLPFLDRKPEDIRLVPEAFARYDVNTDLHPKDEYGR